MRNTFFLLLIILVISCNSSQKNTETIKVENAVEHISAKVDDAIEREKDSSLQDAEEVIEKEAFMPSPFIAKILEQLSIQPKQVYYEFIVQKVLPNDTKSTVVVLPTIANLEDDGYSFSLNNYVLVVDTNTATIKQQFYESNKTNGWDSDAVRIAEITIDTAKYLVKDNLRAFGVRIYFSGSSKPNPYSSRTISLFIPEADKLLKVLDAYEMYSHWGEWDMECTGEFITVNKILTMDSSLTQGFYDIVTHAETTIIETFEKGDDDCDETKTVQKSKQILKYKNGSYQVHKKLYALKTKSPCALKITLEEDQYHIKTSTREHAGAFSVDDGYITFKGLFGDKSKIEVQGSYTEDEIVIQNYGNSMNPFTVFVECNDQKYLHLVKKE